MAGRMPKKPAADAVDKIAAALGLPPVEPKPEPRILGRDLLGGPTDLCWCENCAGTGNILRQMPADRRIGIDLNPQDNGELGIMQGDYRKCHLDPSRRWIVMSNPPFGSEPGDKKGGPLTNFEWAADQDCVIGIGLITPHWFQSPTTENKLHPYFHRLHLEVLPEKSFTRNGQLLPSPTIFTFWVRRNYRRDPIFIRTTHPD